MYLPNHFRITTYFDAMAYMVHMQRLLEHYVTKLFSIDYDFEQNISQGDKPFINLTGDKELLVFLPEAHLFTPSEKDLDKLRKKGYTKLVVGNFENEDKTDYDLKQETSVETEDTVEQAAD